MKGEVARRNWKPVMVLYYDHHDENGADGSGIVADALNKHPHYLILQFGTVVYEDKDWLRLCFEIDDVSGEEKFLCTAIRKSGIVDRVNL